MIERICVCCCVFFVAFSFSCRPGLNLSKIAPDEKTGIYYYKKSIPLRNETGEIVTRHNLDSFLLKIMGNNNLYDLRKYEVNDFIVSGNDEVLVKLYSSVIDCINENKCDDAIEMAKVFKQLHPLAGENSDIDFLVAHAWEKKPDIDTAKYYYQKFLKYSGRKYSLLFRGYNHADSSNALLAAERNYALHFLSDAQTSAVHLRPIKPKYYYESFSQGFVLNREDIGMTSKRVFSAGMGIANRDNIMIGIGVTELLSDKIVLNASYYFSPWKDYIRITLPIQVFKSYNNRFGIKLTPTCDYSYISKINEMLRLDEWYINPGIAPSVGYKINHRLFIGASYTYSLYNQNNQKYFALKGVHMFVWAELDVSLYYQLIKGVSLKVGTSNGYPIVGLNMMGVFLGYSTNPNAMMVRFNDF